MCTPFNTTPTTTSSNNNNQKLPGIRSILPAFCFSSNPWCPPSIAANPIEHLPVTTPSPNSNNYLEKYDYFASSSSSSSSQLLLVSTTSSTAGYHKLPSSPPPSSLSSSPCPSSTSTHNQYHHTHHSNHLNHNNSKNTSKSNNNSRKPHSPHLSKPIVEILDSWLYGNIEYPYPSEDIKRDLVQQTGLGLGQINNWFINARRRKLIPVPWSTRPRRKGANGKPVRNFTIKPGSQSARRLIKN